MPFYSFRCKGAKIYCEEIRYEDWIGLIDLPRKQGEETSGCVRIPYSTAWPSYFQQDRIPL